VPAARAGYPLTIHHDFGKDHGDFELGEKLIDAIKRAKRMLEREIDPLEANTSYGETPKAKLRVCVPHFGMSPQNSGGPKLSAFWKKCLEDDELRETLNADLSWSFTTKYITSDIRDQIRTISPLIAGGLDAWANAYSSFQALGGSADKLTDLKDLSDEAAQRKNASDGIADYYARVVSFVDATVKMELNDPAKAQQFLDLTKDHGDAGNNWLYILANHSDRLMFGTDNLASGIKIHGEAEHMLDALALHPVYSIFRALSRETDLGEGVEKPPRNPALADVVPNLARNAWDEFFLDAECTERRQAMRLYLNDVKPTDTRRAFGNNVSYIDRIDPDADLPARVQALNDSVREIFDEEGAAGDHPGKDVLVALTSGLKAALEKTQPGLAPEQLDVTDTAVDEFFRKAALALAEQVAGGGQFETKPLTLRNAMISELLGVLERQGQANDLLERLKRANWPKGDIRQLELTLATLRIGAEA